ncbi:Lactosylceramide 4-alpha-galactosyltransferase [Eumeta japonica]|uniref:Lactosylceramide 4-alpha-galactosyltransferase n=1 Tax=Eumeta variegata TaxID=151549 RepID=A0A4C1WX98_EUMVA|nr:Lactosylceramide 4-alpha-galactosyltransferase [Eumeta japonica]
MERKRVTYAQRELARNFRGDIWAHNGPGVITRVLQERCNVSTSKMSAEYCDGFEVYGPKLLLPVRWQDWKVYFEPGELDSPETILHHIWNRISSHRTVPADSPYAKLAREFCPTTYNAYKDVF